MSKIVSFNGSNEGLIQNKLLKIKKALQNDSVSKRKLYLLEQEMCELSLDIKDQIAAVEALSSSMFEKFSLHQKELGALVDQCHHLSVDKYVDSITISAQKLACVSLVSNKNFSKKIKKIEKSIKSLNNQEALSLENRELIVIATNFLKAAENHTYCDHMHEPAKTLRLHVKKEKKSPSFEICDLAFDLFEIASLLYSMNTKEAILLFNRLPASEQMHIEALLQNKGTDIKSIKNPESLLKFRKDNLTLIQQLLAYSEELATGQFNEKTEKEIKRLFKDMDIQLKEQAESF